MSGGPIYAVSEYPKTAGKVFPSMHLGDGANGATTGGLGVMAWVDADATWHLQFPMPPVLPSGTGKLRLLTLADAVSGAAKVNPAWASVAAGEDPSAATLTSEGTSTITWSTNDDDEYQELLITLDADTLVGGEVVVMDLVFETTSWTLAVVSTWLAFIIWE